MHTPNVICESMEPRFERLKNSTLHSEGINLGKIIFYKSHSWSNDGSIPGSE